MHAISISSCDEHVVAFSLREAIDRFIGHDPLYCSVAVHRPGLDDQELPIRELTESAMDEQGARAEMATVAQKELAAWRSGKAIYRSCDRPTWADVGNWKRWIKMEATDDELDEWQRCHVRWVSPAALDQYEREHILCRAD